MNEIFMIHECQMNRIVVHNLSLDYRVYCLNDPVLSLRKAV